MTKFTNQNASAPGWALCFMLLLWAPVVASAQVARQPLPAPVQKLINNLESNHDRDAQPAIWLHTDQPYYLNTDTIRLNVFVYNKVARNTRYNGQLWVDLVDRDNVIRRNLLLSVQGGRAYCTLPLGADLADDYYMLTAYTREMTGCGTDCFYQQPLLVLPPWSEAETEKEQLFIDAGSSTIEVKALPVTGQLVAGIETDVYIRARRGFREGVALTGILETAAGDTITDFKLDQLGLGQVAFVPRAGESYHLRIDPRWDISQRIPLRAVSSTGIQVQVKNLIGQGVNVKVERTEDYEPTDDLYLLVQAAGQLVYEGRVDLSRNNVFQTRIDQGDFPIAMAEAVLLTAGGQVLQKQLFYPLEPTVLRMRPLLDGKGQSQPREEVVMEGVLQSIMGDKISGNLAVTVWDSKQLDPSYGPSRLLQAHFLDERMERNNGKVVDKVSTLQKELIMTRQRMYDWSVKATGPVKATLAPGQSFFVSGLVKDRDSGEPVSNGRVAFLMMRDRYTFLAETDEAGRFTVKIPELSRNEEAIYRVFQKTKEIDNASVILDEYEPVYDLTLPDKPQRYTAAMVTYRRKAAVRSQFMDAYGSYFQAEEEVERDYKQLDLPKPDFSVTPDDYVVMQNMEELFREIVPGVFLRNRKDGWRLRIFSPERKESYSNAPLLLVDGQPVFDLDKMLAIDPFNVQRVDTYNFLSSMSQFGSLGSNGVLSIITKDGSFQNAAVDEERVVSIRGYANSSWQEPAPLPGDAGLPLLNPAVYYHPNVRVDESGYFRVRFNQSDELSDFIIQVQGYTDLGEPVIYTTTYSNKTAQ